MLYMHQTTRLMRASFAGSASPPNDASYNLQTTNSPFSFTIARNGSSSNDAPLFSTKGQRLIFKV